MRKRKENKKLLKLKKKGREKGKKGLREWNKKKKEDNKRLNNNNNKVKRKDYLISIRIKTNRIMESVQKKLNYNIV